MDAGDQLLLSEGVCRQLEIVSYHPKVEGEKGPLSRKQGESTKVPVVRVKLVDSLRLLARVELEDGHDLVGTMLLEPTPGQDEELQLGDSLIHGADGKHATILVTNPNTFTQKLLPGTCVGQALEVCVVGEPGGESEHAVSEPEEEDVPVVARVKVKNEEEVKARKQKLAEILKDEGSHLPWQELLMKYHVAFQLDDGERGETDMVQIDGGRYGKCSAEETACSSYPFCGPSGSSSTAPSCRCKEVPG